jgi:hypothetical protein
MIISNDICKSAHNLQAETIFKATQKSLKSGSHLLSLKSAYFSLALFTSLTRNFALIFLSFSKGTMYEP